MNWGFLTYKDGAKPAVKRPSSPTDKAVKKALYEKKRVRALHNGLHNGQTINTIGCHRLHNSKNKQIIRADRK